MPFFPFQLQSNTSPSPCRATAPLVFTSAQSFPTPPAKATDLQWRRLVSVGSGLFLPLLTSDPFLLLLHCSFLLVSSAPCVGCPWAAVPQGYPSPDVGHPFPEVCLQPCPNNIPFHISLTASPPPFLLPVTAPTLS